MRVVYSTSSSDNTNLRVVYKLQRDVHKPFEKIPGYTVEQREKDKRRFEKLAKILGKFEFTEYEWYLNLCWSRMGYDIEDKLYVYFRDELIKNRDVYCKDTEFWEKTVWNYVDML
jgi:hypothetical protein